MSNVIRQLEREEELLEEQLASGAISNKQFNDEMRELYLDYEICAEEAAQEAYDRVIGLW